MAFPKTRSHIIALFVDHGMQEGKAFHLALDCCTTVTNDWTSYGGSPDKKVVKAAIASREAELTYLRLIDVS